LDAPAIRVCVPLSDLLVFRGHCLFVQTEGVLSILVSRDSETRLPRRSEIRSFFASEYSISLFLRQKRDPIAIEVGSLSLNLITRRRFLLLSPKRLIAEFIAFFLIRRVAALFYLQDSLFFCFLGKTFLSPLYRESGAYRTVLPHLAA